MSRKRRAKPYPRPVTTDGTGQPFVDHRMPPHEVVVHKHEGVRIERPHFVPTWPSEEHRISIRLRRRERIWATRRVGFAVDLVTASVSLIAMGLARQFFLLALVLGLHAGRLLQWAATRRSTDDG